ncbi:MAG: glutathione transferase GstA [Myxococcales bacterium]
MLRLFYAPNACSLSPHIALREAGLAFALVRVDFMRNKRLPDGRSLDEVTPKGCVPALLLEDGTLLTEGVAILQYVADRAPERALAPAAGSFERVRLVEWLNFVATDIHKATAPLYGLDTPEVYKPIAERKVAAKLAYVAKHVEQREFLLEHFSVADCYLFYALRSFRRVTKRALEGPLRVYADRIAARPAVRAALEAEGIKY